MGKTTFNELWMQEWQRLTCIYNEQDHDEELDEGQDNRLKDMTRVKSLEKF